MPRLPRRLLLLGPFLLTSAVAQTVQFGITGTYWDGSRPFSLSVTQQGDKLSGYALFKVPGSPAPLVQVPFTGKRTNTFFNLDFKAVPFSPAQFCGGGLVNGRLTLLCKPASGQSFAAVGTKVAWETVDAQRRALQRTQQPALAKANSELGQLATEWSNLITSLSFIGYSVKSADAMTKMLRALNELAALERQEEGGECWGAATQRYFLNDQPSGYERPETYREWAAQEMQALQEDKRTGDATFARLDAILARYTAVYAAAGPGQREHSPTGLTLKAPAALQAELATLRSDWRANVARREAFAPLARQVTEQTLPELERIFHDNNFYDERPSDCTQHVTSWR